MSTGFALLADASHPGPADVVRRGRPIDSEDRFANYPGAQTSNAGQTVIPIDPDRVRGNRYGGRIEALLARGCYSERRRPA